ASIRRSFSGSFRCSPPWRSRSMKSCAAQSCTTAAGGRISSAVLEIVQAGFGQQFRDAAAGAKHARLHGPGRNSNDLRDLCDGLLVIINKVDDFSLDRGEPRQAFAKDDASALFVEDRFRIVRAVHHVRGSILVGRLLPAGPERLERLVACDREHPSRDLRFALETAGSAPDLEKDLAHDILAQRGIPGDAQDEAVDARAMPREQLFERLLVAPGNSLDQYLVRLF